MLIFFLYDFRAGLIVATSIPLALLFAFVCLDLQNASANLLSIGAVDFGILVDGAVVMVENIFRQIAARQGAPLNVTEIIHDAAAEVDRPLFYSVAVIVAGFLPIYVLSGPSGTLFKPMADTMVFALVGSLIVTLTLLPVLCAWFMRKGVRERRNAAFSKPSNRLTPRSRFLPRASLGYDARFGRFAGGARCCSFRASARSSCRIWTRARSGCAPRCPTPSPSTNRRKSLRKVREILRVLSRSHHGRLGAGPPRRRHRSHRLLQRRVLCGSQTLRAVERRLSQQSRADRGHQQEARGISRESPSTTRSRPRMRWMRRKRD